MGRDKYWKKLSKKFELNLEQQIRFYSEAKEFDDYIIDLGGRYKRNKNFKLGSNLRYTYNSKRWKEAENNYRYNIDLNYKFKILNKFTCYYRLRYQYEYVNVFSEFQSTNINSSAVRNRAKVKYKISKNHKVYFSTELFRLIVIFKEPYYNRVRFYIGDEINCKVGKFSLSLGYEQDINDSFPLTFFFLKTIYTLKLWKVLI